jgi:hypothetical protein
MNLGAKVNKKLPELLAAILTKMHERDPESARAAVEAIIEDAAAALPEAERRKFLEELLALARPN